MKLYEISTERQVFIDRYESGDIPEEAFADTLDAIDGEWSQKADDIACMVKNVLSEAEAIGAEIASLLKRKEAKSNFADRLSNYLFRQFKQCSKTKLETSRNLIQVKTNPASVMIDDERKFIEWAKANANNLLTYKEPAPNKKAIKDFLKTGAEMPHASIVQQERLTIK